MELFLCIAGLPLHSANDVAGFEHQDKGHGVAEEDAQQEDVAELPARGSDHRSVVVSEEHARHQGGHHDSCGGKGHRSNRPATVRPQVHFRNGLAPGVHRVRDCSLRTQLALRFVHRVSNLKFIFFINEAIIKVVV